MSINLIQYENRKLDVLAFQDATPNADTLVTQSLATPDDNGEICVGIQKLAQRFLLVFLTDLDSVPGDRTRGTSFMLAFKQGLMRTEAAVMAQFALAELQARATLLAEESTTDPLDEKYNGAILTAIALTPGSAKLSIQVNSLSTSGTFIVPLPIVV